MALPGIDLPLDQKSDVPTEGIDGNWNSRAIPLTVRERIMLDLMATLKNKRDWESKIFDNDIVRKWRAEALASGDSWRARDESQTGEVQGLAPAAKLRQRVVSQAMFDYCVEELRAQAPVSESRGFTEVFDANATVYISDTVVSHDTKMALRSSVAPLENVRDALKDWHPGSDGKVLDLVHPSLYPLMYGTSRFLRQDTVSLNDCARFSGRGEVVPRPEVDDVHCGYSLQHQWLPCEVHLDGSGDAAITSYINNLHPVANGPLYKTIEQVITKSVPMWKLALRSVMFQYERPRIDIQGDGYDHDAAEADHNAMYEEKKRAWKQEKAARKRKRPQNDEMIDYGDDLEDSEIEAWHHDDIVGDDYLDPYQDQYIQLPDPDTYQPRERLSTEDGNTEFEQMFAERRLQVIVKLANIHLSPEKPSYHGGSWHIEGLPNEHICASALYYYDSANVTDSHLAFRENVNHEYLDATWTPGPSYEQHRYEALWEIFGLYGEDNMSLPSMQVVGQVLTREDRLLVFPNVLQHCVQPFQLADPTKPGHRKILALFLVDPSIRIPSTANVPPQQRDWWAKQINEEGLLSKLPPEVAEHIYDEVEGFPLSIEQAKQVRGELMAERGAQNDEIANGTYSDESYCFCEH